MTFVQIDKSIKLIFTANCEIECC